MELFGCLIVDKNVVESEPHEENNYCLEISPETAEKMGVIPDTPEHVTLSSGEYPIPKEATDRKHSTSIYSKLDVHNRTELIYKLTKQ